MANLGSIKSNHGFTLIELLVVVSIVGILLFSAVNGYSSWLQRTKSEDLTHELQRSFSLAQSTAIKLGGRIRLCASNDAATCSGSFSQGWIIFSDSDDSAQVDGAESIIRAFENNSNIFTVSMLNTEDSSSVDAVPFNYKGYLDYPIQITVSGASLTNTFEVKRNGYIE